MANQYTRVIGIAFEQDIVQLLLNCVRLSYPYNSKIGHFYFN